MNSVVEKARALLREYFPRAMEQLELLVKIPSISWPSFDERYVHESAETVAYLATQTNIFDSVEILSAPTPSGEMGKPAVVAKKVAGAGMPTVLLYAHHDVQPPGDETLWNSPPFDPKLVGDRYYGRGVADDKAGIILHLTAVKLLELMKPGNQLGLVLFIEGEEEYGSPSFEQFLTDYKNKLSSEVIIVADSGNWDLNTPALTTSLRGNVTFNLSISTLDHALHSGMFGGVAPDAVSALSLLLASFYDSNGNVNVSGLTYVSAEVPVYAPERFREEAGLLANTDLIGAEEISERLWLHPAITVTGIDVTNVANASNTLIPHVKARISVRVSPSQSSQEAFDAVMKHISENIPFGAKYEVENVNIGEGYFAEDSGGASLSYRKSLLQAWGKEPVNIGVGGSIPFISSFMKIFPHAEVLITGVEDPDSRAHSPNESLHVPSFEKVIMSELLFLLHYLEADSSTE